MSGTSLNERVMILEFAESGNSDPKTASRLHLSSFTVRKWRRKGQREGTRGLVSHMGRPRRGSLSSYPTELTTTLQQWREAHPGWGPVTLHTELGLRYTNQPVPSTASISRWLKEKDYPRRYERHQELSDTRSDQTPQACHQEWEMDAKGHQRVEAVGVISLINLNDVFSKVKLLSYPCWLGEKRATRHPTTEDYQLVLRLAFYQWGFPDRLAVDHDSVYYDNRSKSPFPTRLHLWLLALGVQLTFGRFHQPTDQAMTERSHQTWDRQVLEGGCFSAQAALAQSLAKRCDFLNEHLPCASLGDQPPLVAHPEARTPRRRYRPEWEAELLNLAAVHSYLANHCWFRKASNVGTVSLGSQVYYLANSWKRAEVTITFDPADQHLVFTAEHQETKRLPIRKLAPQDLMGELAPLLTLPNFQLALPVTWEEWRSSYCCQLLGGTTL